MLQPIKDQTHDMFQPITGLTPGMSQAFNRLDRLISITSMMTVLLEGTDYLSIQQVREVKKVGQIST